MPARSSRALACLALVASSAACTAPLPTAAPQVLTIAIDRIETNASADAAALDRLVRNADSAGRHISAAIEHLDSDRTETARAALVRAHDAIATTDRLRARAPRSARSTAETLDALRTLASVVESKARHDAVLRSLLDELQPTGDTQP